MRFSQLDRIVLLEQGKMIKAIKCLALSEEYLQDHFPRFPIMPGVLMHEAALQASSWLIRATHKFQYSTVVLRESKGLKFQGMVQPGDTLEISAEIKSMEDSITKLKVAGVVNGKPCTSGRLVLDTYNLADRDENVDPAIDRYMNHKFRQTFRRLCNQLDQTVLSSIEQVPLVP